MSATLLYHMHGIRSDTYLKHKIVPGGIEFSISAGASQLVCPCCGSINVWQKGGKERRFRSAPTGRKTTTIILMVPRVFCRDCKTTRQIKISFAEEHKRHTRFCQTAIERCYTDRH